jgi:hypothetical protein
MFGKGNGPNYDIFKKALSRRIFTKVVIQEPAERVYAMCELTHCVKCGVRGLNYDLQMLPARFVGVLNMSFYEDITWKT